MSELLTVRQAMARVRRSRRTIETWIAEGLPVAWYSNVRHVRLDHLLAELKKRNLANPSKAWEPAKSERVRHYLTRKYSTDTPEN